MMLPMILVQNQIRNVLGGERGKITFGRIKYNTGLVAKEFRLCTIYWDNVWVGAGCKVIDIKFMTVFIMQRDAACF